MKKFIKEIWSKFPNWIKWFAGGVLLFSLLDKVITSIRDGEPLVISEGWLYLLLSAIVLIIIGLVIGVSRIAYKNFSKSEPLPTPIYTSAKKLKMLPPYIDLWDEKNQYFEFTVKAIRCFSPNDKPGLENFLQVITIRPILCSECKSEIGKIYSDRRLDFVYSCQQMNCKNYLKSQLNRNEYDDVVKQYILQITSKIRKDFNRYWQLYIDKYSELTGSKYDEYYEPINFFRREYYL
jgi:hypothetical protein